jgi:hypothetical protein
MHYLAISLVVLFPILLFTSDIYIKPQFMVDENGYHTTITAYIFMKLLKIRRQIGPGGIRKPGRNKGKDDPVKKHGLLEIYDEYMHIRDFYNSAEDTIKYIMKKMDIEEIRIVTTIGTDDACLTAISAGLACAIAGMIVSVVTNISEECKKNISIIPDFSGNRFNLNLYCILKTKIAYIIVAGLKYLTYLLMRKIKKARHINKKCKC